MMQVPASRLRPLLTGGSCSILRSVKWPLPILYADKWERFVVINKPSGLPCVESDYLYDSIRVRLAEALPWRTRVWFPHRLDKHAQGAMVVAFSHEACGDLGKSLMAGEWRKRYRVVAPLPPQSERARFRNPLVHESGQSPLFEADGSLRESGTIASFLGVRCALRFPHPQVQASTLRRAVAGDDAVAHPKWSVTHFRLAAADEAAGRAMYDVTLSTGRTHQIRVHFAESGLPLANDWYYNPACTHWPPSDNLPGELGLQAYTLEMPLLPQPPSYWDQKTTRVEQASLWGDEQARGSQSGRGWRRLGRWTTRDRSAGPGVAGAAKPWTKADGCGADSAAWATGSSGDTRDGGEVADTDDAGAMLPGQPGTLAMPEEGEAGVMGMGSVGDEVGSTPRVQVSSTGRLSITLPPPRTFQVDHFTSSKGRHGNRDDDWWL